MFDGRFSIGGLERELAEFEVCAAMGPIPTLEVQGLLEVRLGFRVATERRARDAALVQPQRLFAEHLGTWVARIAGKAVGEELVRISGSARAEARGSSFEPHYSIAWKCLTQLRELRQRVVIAAFAVVHHEQREPRVRLIVAGIASGPLDQLKSLLAAASEPSDVRHPAERHRQARDDVAVGADDKAGVFAGGVE